MAPQAGIDVPSTFGALLIGGLYSALLTGVVVIQVIIYFKTYPSDKPSVKALVLLIWLLDTIHSALVWAGLWNYLIGFFGVQTHIDFIPVSVSCSVAVTGVLTFVVHCFFSHRIFKLGRKNWFLILPIMVLAVCRLASALGTTAQMIRLKSLYVFKHEYSWLFTLGLALSIGVDILITGFLFVLLKTSRTTDFNLNAIIDTLILYAFETGALTTVGAIVSMVCWVVMPHNLIFMALHFVIAKLYANSILVTLNTRTALRRARSTTTTGSGGGNGNSRRFSRFPESPTTLAFPFRPHPNKVTINVERSIHHDDGPAIDLDTSSVTSISDSKTAVSNHNHNIKLSINGQTHTSQTLKELKRQSNSRSPSLSPSSLPPTPTSATYPHNGSILQGRLSNSSP